MDQLVRGPEQLASRYLGPFWGHEGQVVRIFLGQGPEPEVTHSAALLRDSIRTGRVAPPIGQSLEHVLSYGTDTTTAPGFWGGNSGD